MKGNRGRSVICIVRLQFFLSGLSLWFSICNGVVTSLVRLRGMKGNIHWVRTAKQFTLVSKKQQKEKKLQSKVADQIRTDIDGRFQPSIMEAKDLLPNEPTELGSPQPSDISWLFMSGGKICTFGIVKKHQELHQNCAADGIFTSREFRLETRIIRVFLGFWFFTRLCSAEPCLCGGVGHGAGRWENSETSTVKRRNFEVWGGP